MHTVDRALIRAPLERVFAAAANVERWPKILAHYRWVRFLDRSDGGGLVEMAAWRPFGVFRYPTWWVSQMTVDRAAGEIRYRHVRGLTRGMAVVWRLAAQPRGVQVAVGHHRAGPAPGPVGALAGCLRFGPGCARRCASSYLPADRRCAET